MYSTTDRPMITSAAALLAAYADGERDFPWRVRLPWGANLRGAHLRGAHLRGANLRGADLTGADLRGADLRGADLTDAHLTGAHLRGADLRGADLRGADLTGADLRGADLTDAHLRDADLRGADMTGADLTPIRDDLYGYLAHVPQEVPGLLATLEAGRIDGSTYDGPCACLAGTCERLSFEAGDHPRTSLVDLRDAGSPREVWFLAIRPGDTPATNPVAAITAEWLRAWLEEHPQPEPPQPPAPNEPERRPLSMAGDAITDGMPDTLGA